jgi:hypothetical protein
MEDPPREKTFLETPTAITQGALLNIGFEGGDGSGCEEEFSDRGASNTT